MAIYFECVKCKQPTSNPANEYGEHVCTSCQENASEAAYERHIASFYEGAAREWMTFLQQQAEAWKLK